MLPFTTIPFVKGKISIKNDSNDNTCPQNSDQDRRLLPDDNTGNSAEFYRSVINEPSTSHRNSISKSCKISECKTITQSSYKALHNHVCNDAIDSVKEWFSCYIPDSMKKGKNRLSNMSEVVEKLCDESGCNIAMTAAAHRSYESLKFLLTTIPELAMGNDHCGITFNDVVESLLDERIDRIVNKIDHTNLKEIENKRTSPTQSKSYCEQCCMFHSDPDHESSISHLIAENRAVPEINPHLDPNNAGYKMMSKLGWSENKGLGLSTRTFVSFPCLLMTGGVVDISNALSIIITIYLYCMCC